jgi:two-component system cell cycle sensor histidine kinase/response regulator CckA
LSAQPNVARDDAITAVRFPIRLLSLVCLLTIAAFVWFSWIIFEARRDAKMFENRLSRIEELRGVIIHLDEVLTMSARMAAATGDLQWEERYRRFDPQLDAAIKETIKIGTGPSDVKAATKTDGANIKLVEMENRAFALVRAGRREDAQAVLLNPEYGTQKQIYAEGITSFVNQIRREFDESFRGHQRIDLLSIIAALVVGGASFVAWFSAARGVRRWRAQLLDSVHRRSEAEENLRRTHAELEVRVKERTADLAKTNETLQAEISERKRAEWQLNIQYAISRVLMESSTLKEASARILQTVCEILNWKVGEFYTVDRRAGVMQFDDTWSVPNAQIDAFTTLSRKTTFVRGIGLPGRVWASGKAIWIPDVVVDENFPRASAAKQVGLHGAFCFPILSGNEVSGVIEFFSHEIRQPDEELLRVFAVLGSQLGQFFERKRAEVGLQRSEAHTKAIVQSSLDCIITIDHEGKILEFNPAAEIVFGYPRAKVLGMELAEVIIPPSLREQHRQGLNRYLATGEAKVLGKRIEIAAIRSDGKEFPVELTITRLGAEEPPMFTGFIRDITERKQGEDALRASEERYRGLFESNPNPMWVYDIEMLSFLAVNSAAVRHYGYSQDEFLTMTLKDIRPTEDVSTLVDDLSQGPGTDGLDNLTQWRHSKKDGALIDVEITSHELTWLGRRAKLVLINDVTERKHAEDRLRQQARLLDLAHDAIMVRDMEDRVEFWNHGAEDLYGWTAAEVQGRKASAFLHQDEPGATAAARAEVIEKGKWTGECKHNCKDGGTTTVRSRWTLVRDELAAPKSILIINTDVSEQRKLETHLLRAQRLESIGTLASGVAHDLNNILTPILMCTEVLKGSPKREDLPSLVSMIEESARRGANVVKQVLTFARGIEGERVVIKPSHLIQEMIDIAQKTFPKTIEILSRYPSDVWSIKGDPTQLHQVLLNLSVNARDAMLNGGTLTLAAENFSVDENYASMMPGAKPGPHVMLRVTDTGRGMPRAMIDKIFDPFFTTKEVGKGTGLGLSTTLGIVKSHGGFISVYSEPGKGTTFKLFLPAATIQEDLQQSKTSVVPIQGNGHGQLILVVDDEPNILGVTKMILGKHRYDVVSASDGPEALAIFAQQMKSISLVLTDLSMPYMDGVALVRSLKKMRPDLAIVASTGQGEQAGVAELQSLGVKNFLTKPYDTQQLLATIHDSLQEKAVSPV